MYSEPDRSQCVKGVHKIDCSYWHKFWNQETTHIPCPKDAVTVPSVLNLLPKGVAKSSFSIPKGIPGCVFFFFYTPCPKGWLTRTNGMANKPSGVGTVPQSRREMVNGFNAIPRDQATLAAARQAAAAAPAAATATPCQKEPGSSQPQLAAEQQRAADWGLLQTTAQKTKG